VKSLCFHIPIDTRATHAANGKYRLLHAITLGRCELAAELLVGFADEIVTVGRATVTGPEIEVGKALLTAVVAAVTYDKVREWFFNRVNQ
jgi:hypothetical protein